MTTAKKRMTPADLGIDTTGGDPEALYRWFLASLLFGNRIEQATAARTYHVLIENGLTSPEAFAGISREDLSALLVEGGYRHYRWLEDDELHRTMAAVSSRYGSVKSMLRSSGSAGDLEHRLLAFDGVGPTTARIFMQWVPASLHGTMPAA
ncbi:hypothetical protein BN1051_02903 [Arthrobacter saudimassiliensis]|uniref:DNA methylase n=1 Tax=Arthrobacter saudimassiliensis TaxID=1461584 RepID=A0A078MQN7_9MICC|nr:hypothetical protein BN1051_02903 [Arthrobacter saudimassiliensis]